MTIGVVATITIAEGSNAEFEQAFLVLAEQVRANEPGNIFYIPVPFTHLTPPTNNHGWTWARL